MEEFQASLGSWLHIYIKKKIVIKKSIKPPRESFNKLCGYKEALNSYRYSKINTRES